MLLYHYTAGQNLRGIAKEGLTVGDVPTDLLKFRGRVGVWFTASDDPNGHGLDGSQVDKKRFRLSVEVTESPLLVSWPIWAKSNVTPFTLQRLNAAVVGTSRSQEWWVCFGLVRPEQILQAIDMSTGEEVHEWQTSWPNYDSQPGIPFRQREAWQKRMLKDVKRALRQR